MAGRIPENVLDEILSRVNIVEVISGYIPLKRAGRNFKASCPFHQEKTPSFMVSPQRQIYHCFGCGQSGNVFKFLMSYERLEFPEAVEILAKKAGVVLPKWGREDDKTTSLYAQLYKINELAAAFYQQILNSSEYQSVRNYLMKRGLNDEVIKLFKLGFAPNKWDALIEHLRAKNISLTLLEKAGLVLSRGDGGFYDRFRNRIMIPIFDIKSRILGFGARIFQEEKTVAKYINSPETPIYIKGRNLYGLNFAREAIREKDAIAIAEGYFDFITPYKEGLQNVVASLGTALTIEQISLLKRYTNNVVMVYDADDAGQLATLRTLDIFIEEGMDVKVVSLPAGFDPDLFVREKGVEKLKNKIEEAKNLFDYKLEVLKSRHNLKEIDGKVKICVEILPTIKRFKNAVLKSEYIKRLAEELDVKEDALLQELNKLKEDKFYSAPSSPSQSKELNLNPTEKLLIKLVLEEKELIEHIRQHLSPEDFQDERIAKIVSVMFELIEQGKDIEPSKLIEHFEDRDSLKFICESIFDSEVSLDDRERVVDDCIRIIKRKKLTLKRQRLQEEIKNAESLGDEERLNKLKNEFCNLVKKRR